MTTVISAPNTCDWAACHRVPVRHLDGWWHCRLHVFEHLSMQPHTQSVLIDLAEERRLKQQTEKERKTQAEADAADLLHGGFRGYTADDLRSRDTTRHITEARQDLMFLLWSHTGISTVQLGRLFGRDHSTVIHAVRRARERAEVAT